MEKALVDAHNRLGLTYNLRSGQRQIVVPHDQDKS